MLLTSIILEIITIANIYVMFDICTFYEKYAKKFKWQSYLDNYVVNFVSFLKIRSFEALTDDILYLIASEMTN